MHAKFLRILEKLDQHAREAAARRQHSRLRGILLRVLLLVEADKAFRLRSPRCYRIRAHFPLISYWKHSRALPDSLADSSYMMFLAFPRFVFDELAERIRPDLPRFDPALFGGRGRPNSLDYKDLLAIGLRSLRVVDQDRLSIDFCLPQPRISEALAKIRPILADAVRVCVGREALAKIRPIQPASDGIPTPCRYCVGRDAALAYSGRVHDCRAFKIQ
jgi:hypothetical protein